MSENFCVCVIFFPRLIAQWIFLKISISLLGKNLVQGVPFAAGPFPTPHPPILKFHSVINICNLSVSNS